MGFSLWLRPPTLFCRIPLCYVPHTCRQPIRTVQPIVSFLRYSPNRTGMSWHPFLSLPQGPQCSSGPVWKSTYSYPASYCLILSTVYTRLLNVSLLAWNYRKHIAQTTGSVCICYITLPSSIGIPPKAHIAAFFWSWLVFCSICPISQPFQHHFLCYLHYSRSPSRLSAQLRRLRCFQARRESKLWRSENP